MFSKFSIALIVAAALIVAGCGAGGGDTAADTGKVIKSGPAGNNLTATLSSPSGVLKNGKQDFTLTFTNAAGAPVDVGSVALNFHMPAMGSMAVMNNPATFKTTNTPGVYAGTVDLDMAGEWQAQITYDGPAGKGRANLPVVAQ